jgi:hypothetical protein
MITWFSTKGSPNDGEQPRLLKAVVTYGERSIAKPDDGTWA